MEVITRTGTIYMQEGKTIYYLYWDVYNGYRWWVYTLGCWYTDSYKGSHLQGETEYRVGVL